jgi:hypothetical protein
MAEHSGEDKYIKCSKCKCKYINDDEHIKADFGYNRLNERFKTCTKCRTKTSKGNDKKEPVTVVTVVNYPEESQNTITDSEAYELFFKSLDITSKSIKREIVFDIDDLIKRYGEDGYGDKPKNINKITYWAQHLDILKYIK